MLFVYPAIFHKEQNAYWVEFPDLPGCQTYGEALTETVALAQEALSGYLLTLLEDGRDLAQPSDMSAIKCGADSFGALISCTIDPYKDTKSVRKTLTIPAWLNDRAIAQGVNFSKVLQDALISRIQG